MSGCSAPSDSGGCTLVVGACWSGAPPPFLPGHPCGPGGGGQSAHRCCTLITKTRWVTQLLTPNLKIKSHAAGLKKTGGGEF